MNRCFQRGLSVLIVVSFLLTNVSVPVQTASAQFASDENHLLLLQYGVINTSLGEPSLSTNLRIVEFPPGLPGYYFVQFIDVILPEWRADLEATGGK